MLSPPSVTVENRSIFGLTYRPAPELDPKRKISEQDCTKSIVPDAGNLCAASSMTMQQLKASWRPLGGGWVTRVICAAGYTHYGHSFPNSPGSVGTKSSCSASASH